VLAPWSALVITKSSVRLAVSKLQRLPVAAAALAVAADPVAAARTAAAAMSIRVRAPLALLRIAERAASSRRSAPN
jgi:hypothetical protein